MAKLTTTVARKRSKSSTSRRRRSWLWRIFAAPFQLIAMLLDDPIIWLILGCLALAKFGPPRTLISYLLP